MSDLLSSVIAPAADLRASIDAAGGAESVRASLVARAPWVAPFVAADVNGFGVDVGAVRAWEWSALSDADIVRAAEVQSDCAEHNERAAAERFVAAADKELPTTDVEREAHDASALAIRLRAAVICHKMQIV